MTREEHEVLPGELTTFRAVGVLGFGLGALGGISLWLTDPAVIHSNAVAWFTTLVCIAMAGVMATVSWGRVHPAWLLTPATVAAVVIAAAIQNMDGGREVYDGFFLYLALSGAYFLPGRYMRIIIAIIALASAVPLIADSSSESIVRWAYVAAGNGTVAIVLRAARVRVREYAAEVALSPFRTSSPARSTAVGSRSARRPRSPAHGVRSPPSRSSTSTSTASSASTTTSATRPGIASYAARRWRWRPSCAARTSSGGSAATSSSCCWPAPPMPTPTRSRAASSRPSRGSQRSSPAPST